jgi:hypothetical protein
MFPDAFLANYALHADFAKPSKFMVLIYQPPGLMSGGLFGGFIGGKNSILGTEKISKGINTAGLSLQCDQASLPGYAINTVDQRIFGASWKSAGTPMYPETLDLQFICAGDMWERKFFEDWMEFIMPKDSRRISADKTVEKLFTNDATQSSASAARYRNEYCGTIQVIQFHETGIPSVRYTFEECFPINMPPQQLDWGNTDVHRLPVSFSYRTWSREENTLKQIYDQFKKSGKRSDIVNNSFAGS